MSKSSRTSLNFASPQKLKEGEITHGKNSNQATFKLNENSILLWRRVLLIRYYQILGGESNVDVKWCDFDAKQNVITCSDEKKTFEWKLPHKNLYKSVLHANAKKKKKFVITLFYTTNTAQIQGQMVSEWLEQEFPLINKTVNELLESKGDKTVKVDKVIENIKFISEMLYSEPLDHTEKSGNRATKDNVLNDSEKKIETDNDTGKTEENGATSDNVINKPEKQMTDNDCRDTEEIDKIKTAIHTLEGKQLEKDEKIDKIIGMHTSLLEKISTLTTKVGTMQKEIIEIKDALKFKNEIFNKNLDSKIENGVKTACKSEFLENKSEIGRHKDQFNERFKQLEKNHIEITQKLDNLYTEVIDVKHKTKENRRTTEEDNYVEIDSIQENIEHEEKKEQSSRVNKPVDQRTRDIPNDFDPEAKDLWIIGTSIIKDLEGKKNVQKQTSADNNP